MLVVKIDCCGVLKLSMVFLSYPEIFGFIFGYRSGARAEVIILVLDYGYFRFREDIDGTIS